MYFVSQQRSEVCPFLNSTAFSIWGLLDIFRGIILALVVMVGECCDVMEAVGGDVGKVW